MAFSLGSDTLRHLALAKSARYLKSLQSVVPQTL
jgi:hypothetical protein